MTKLEKQKQTTQIGDQTNYCTSIPRNNMQSLKIEY